MDNITLGGCSVNFRVLENAKGYLNLMDAMDSVVQSLKSNHGFTTFFVDAIATIPTEEVVARVSGGLYSLLEEEWMGGDVIPAHIHSSIEWISIKLICDLTPLRVTGRAELRKVIKLQLENEQNEQPFCSFDSTPPRAPALHIPIDTPPWKDEPRVSNGQERNTDPLARASETYKEQTPASIIKMFQHSGIKAFDGANACERYLFWKHQVTDLISTSHIIKGWSRVELIMASLKGGALMAVRQSIRNDNLYGSSCEHAEKEFFSCLDKKCHTVNATRYVDNIFDSFAQLSNETMEGYLTRFENLLHEYQSIKGINLDDNAIMSKFARGIMSPAGKYARALADAAGISKFNLYAQACLSYALVPIPHVANAPRGQNGVMNNALTLNKGICYRCKKPGHNAIACRQPLILPAGACQRCGDRRHTEDKCFRVIKKDCGRCGGKHFESACQKTPHRVDNNALTVDGPSSTFDDLTEIRNCSIGVSYVDNEGPIHEVLNASVEVSFSHIDTQSDLVSPDIPSVRLRIGCHDIDALLDNGASANFISKGIATLFLKEGQVSQHDVKKISSPFQVTYGNGMKEKCDCYINLTVVENGRPWNLKFLVVRNCNPSIIIGRTGLQILGYRFTRDIDMPLIEEVPAENGIKLIVRHYPMERALVDPFHESKRRRSITDSLIIHERLLQMESLGQIKRVPIEECHCTLEVVLVDKKPGTPKIFPSEDLHARYRVTLDLRPLNKLQCFDDGNNIIFIPQQVGKADKIIKESKQFQLGAMELLRTSRMTSCKFFCNTFVAKTYDLPPRLYVHIKGHNQLCRGCGGHYKKLNFVYHPVHYIPRVGPPMIPPYIRTSARIQQTHSKFQNSKYFSFPLKRYRV